MRKKIIFGFLIIFVFMRSNVFGEETRQNPHIIYVGIDLFFPPMPFPGFKIEYEYSFNDRFSVSVDIGADAMPWEVVPYAEIKGLWYPWSRTFFVGLGIGGWGLKPSYFESGWAYFAISPTIGWRINIGQQNRWVIMPSITSRQLFLNRNWRDNNKYGSEWGIINFSVGRRF